MKREAPMKRGERTRPRARPAPAPRAARTLARRLARRFAQGLVFALAVRATEARAGSCSSLVAPVYVTGSSAAMPLLAELAKTLATTSPTITVVYQGSGSCAGVEAFFKGTPLSGAATYWDTEGEHRCDLAAAGAPIDVAISDVYTTTCDPSFQRSETIEAFDGPVQTMTFVVPNASEETSISAEAAYFVYGFGASSGVAPWTDPAYLFQRGPSSGTQQMIATAIGVPAPLFQGALTSSSGDLEAKVSASMAPKATLGILAADVAEGSSSLKVLAYQHYDQACGYYPNTNATKRDKRNVRDGHYAIWGNLHFVTHVNVTSGEPMNEDAATIIKDLTGKQLPPAGVDLIRLEAQHRVFPICAMRVKRAVEMGPLASFMPDRSCACYYDVSATGETSCTPCKKDGDCSTAAPRCNFGYCELQ